MESEFQFDQDDVSELMESKLFRERQKEGTPPATQLYPESEKGNLFAEKQEIKYKKYSLLPDMQLDWKPKFLFQGPIFLSYRDSFIDSLIISITANQLETPATRFRLAYLGFRPKDSYVMHDSFTKMNLSGYKFKYIDMIRHKYESVLQYLDTPLFADIDDKLNNRPFLGMAPWLSESPDSETEGTCDYTIDSYFECGNIDCAIQTGPDEFDLYIRPDTNTQGHTQWYYFRVRNKEKGQKIVLNLCNFTKYPSLYNYGKKPFVFSSKLEQAKGVGWQQSGDNVRFRPILTKYQHLLKKRESEKKMYMLSFEYTFHYDCDDVYFSYCIPYSYSKLMATLGLLKQNTSNVMQEGRLCQSLSGLDLPLLTVTDFKDTDNLDRRWIVVVTARIHPGETNGSWVMHGFLSYVTSDTPTARLLRSLCVFKIIPMLNPDGVVLGNFRCSFTGKDLNRVFKSQSTLYPTVQALKTLIQELKRKHGSRLLVNFDFHGHSNKKNVFSYGPQYPLGELSHFKGQFLPKTLDQISDMFRFTSCTFTISECKLTTARAYVFYDFKVPFTYTFESSMHSYVEKKSGQEVPFTPASYQLMGVQIAQATQDYIEMIVSFDENVKDQQTVDQLLRMRSQQGGSAVEASYLDHQNKLATQNHCDPLAEQQPILQQQSPDATGVRKSRKLSQKINSYQQFQTPLKKKFKISKSRKKDTDLSQKEEQAEEQLQVVQEQPTRQGSQSSKRKIMFLTNVEGKKSSTFNTKKDKQKGEFLQKYAQIMDEIEEKNEEYRKEQAEQEDETQQYMHSDCESSDEDLDEKTQKKLLVNMQQKMNFFGDILNNMDKIEKEAAKKKRVKQRPKQKIPEKKEPEKQSHSKKTKKKGNKAVASMKFQLVPDFYRTGIQLSKRKKEETDPPEDLKRKLALVSKRNASENKAASKQTLMKTVQKRFNQSFCQEQELNQSEMTPQPPKPLKQSYNFQNSNYFQANNIQLDHEREFDKLDFLCNKTQLKNSFLRLPHIYQKLRYFQQIKMKNDLRIKMNMQQLQQMNNIAHVPEESAPGSECHSPTKLQSGKITQSIENNQNYFEDIVISQLCKSSNNKPQGQFIPEFNKTDLHKYSLNSRRGRHNY